MRRIWFGWAAAAPLLLATACGAFGAQDGPEDIPAVDGGADADGGAEADRSAEGDAGRPAPTSRIALRGATAGTRQASAASDLLVPLPSGLEAGDLLWATLALRVDDGEVNFDSPKDWTELEARTSVCPTATPVTKHTVHHYYRIASGAEPTQVPLGRAGSYFYGDVVVLAFSGVDPARPIARHLLVDVHSGPLASPELDVDVDGGRLLVAFSHALAEDATWEPIADMQLRPWVGRVGLYDAPVARGIAPARVGISSETTVCGATALAAVLRALP